jgi:hypothetical protein
MEGTCRHDRTTRDRIFTVTRVRPAAGTAPQCVDASDRTAPLLWVAPLLRVVPGAAHVVKIFRFGASARGLVVRPENLAQPAEFMLRPPVGRSRTLQSQGAGPGSSGRARQ